ncbi:hypothetical protein BdWA1_001288 [Babesia duncani]|uniref:Uncharacterized protein n=1 Tax=Babesia duncani TaxID=323732 RepID=A0AAD9UQW4_9APIC|nr:hypothetical protein BdWA1_001288 [Babesia duncani]
MTCKMKKMTLPRDACVSGSGTSLSSSEWDEKWHSMVEHQRQRREMDAQLKFKLEEKLELQEKIECTFTPKTLFRSRPTAKQSQELVEQMQPLIEQEERILRQLQAIEMRQEQRAREMGQGIYNCVLSMNDSVTETPELMDLCNAYRKARLIDMAHVKNEKLDIVGLLHELERRYNIVCVGVCVSQEDMANAGFSIDKCKRIKLGILEGIRGHETLKERSQITMEIEKIISNAREAKQQQRARSQQPSPQVRPPQAHYYPQVYPHLQQQTQPPLYPQMYPQMHPQMQFQQWGPRFNVNNHFQKAPMMQNSPQRHPHLNGQAQYPGMFSRMPQYGYIGNQPRRPYPADLRCIYQQPRMTTSPIMTNP